MTPPTTTTTTRQERGIALAQQPGAVRPLTARCDTFHVKSSQPLHGPYTVRHSEWTGWRCTCPDARHNVCKHIHAVQTFLRLPRVLLTVTPRRSSVACRAYAPGVAATEEAALVRHHETGNTTLELPWSIEYVEFLEEMTTRRGNRVAVLRAESGLRWYVPMDAWEVIQPRILPEAEMATLGVAS